MPISWISSFNSFPNFPPIIKDKFFYAKDKIFTFLDTPQKKVWAAIAIIAVSCFLAHYLLRRCCCSGAESIKKLNPVDSAKNLLNQGNYKEAEVKFNEILAKDSNQEDAKRGCVDAKFGYAKALQNQGEYKAAELKYNEILATYPDNQDAHNGYAEALLNQQDYKGAKNRYHEVLAKDPNNEIAKRGYLDAAMRCTEALLNQGKYKNALDNYKDVLQDKPDADTAAAAVIGCVKALQKLEDFEEAEKISRKYYKSHSNNNSFLSVYFETLITLEKYDKVKGLIEEILEDDPDNEIVIETRGKVDRLIKESRVYELIESAEDLYKSDSSEADKKFKEALELGCVRDYVFAHYAVNQFKQNKLPEAKKSFEAALKINDKNVYALVYYSGLLEKLGERQESGRKSRLAFKINEEEAEACTDKMEKLVRKLEENNKKPSPILNDFSALVNHAVELRNEGNLNEAIVQFEAALKLDPGNDNTGKIYALANYAEALSLQSKLENVEQRKKTLAAAEQHFETALKVATDDSADKFYTFAYYGETLSLQSKLEDAERRKQKLAAAEAQFKEALKLKTNDSDKVYALAHYGETLSQLGKLENAEERQQKLAAAESQFKEALALKTDNNSDRVYALAHYGGVLYKQSKFGQQVQRNEKLGDAAFHFNAALEIKPDDVYSLAHYTKILFEQGKLDKASLIGENQFENDLLSTPEALSAQSNFGEEEDLSVDIDVAATRGLEKQVAELDNEEKLLKDAKSLIEQNKFPEAKIKYKKVLANNNKNTDAMIGLAQIYENKKNWNKAKVRYNHVLNIDKENRIAKEAVEKMEEQKKKNTQKRKKKKPASKKILVNKKN